MKFAPSRFKQAELSDKEKIALREIAEGGFIALPLCQRLQKLGLVEKRLDVWSITPQGRIHLMFQGAR
jgi:ribosomal protein S19E (S16A)